MHWLRCRAQRASTRLHALTRRRPSPVLRLARLFQVEVDSRQRCAGRRRFTREDAGWWDAGSAARLVLVHYSKSVLDPFEEFVHCVHAVAFLHADRVECLVANCRCVESVLADGGPVS